MVWFRLRLCGELSGHGGPRPSRAAAWLKGAERKPAGVGTASSRSEETAGTGEVAFTGVVLNCVVWWGILWKEGTGWMRVGATGPCDMGGDDLPLSRQPPMAVMGRPG